MSVKLDTCKKVSSAYQSAQNSYRDKLNPTSNSRGSYLKYPSGFNSVSHKSESNPGLISRNGNIAKQKIVGNDFAEANF